MACPQLCCWGGRAHLYCLLRETSLPKSLCCRVLTSPRAAAEAFPPALGLTCHSRYLQKGAPSTGRALQAGACLKLVKWGL